MANLYQPANFGVLVELVEEIGFAPDWYRRRYWDLHGIPSDRAALVHFLLHGLDEQRSFPTPILRSIPLIKLKDLGIEDADRHRQLIKALIDGHAQTVNPFDKGTLSTAWPDLERLQAHGFRPYLIIGDSHSAIYATSGYDRGEWLVPIHAKCIGGSAVGLGNPHSLSRNQQFIAALLDELETLPRSDAVPILFEFGQVDLEFVYTRHLIETDSRQFDIDNWMTFITRSIDSYARFLCQAIPITRRANVAVLSVNPPALSDENWKVGYVHGQLGGPAAPPEKLEQLLEQVKSLEIPDHLRRTHLHARFNMLLSSVVRQNGFRFIDNFYSFLGSDGILDKKFSKFSNGANHHIDVRHGATIAREIVWKLLRESSHDS